MITYDSYQKVLMEKENFKQGFDDLFKESV